MTVVSKYASSNTVVTTGWTNPTNAYADDTSFATAAPGKNSSVTSDFGFASFTTSDIPDGSVINSVTLTFLYKSSTTGSTGAGIGLACYSNGGLVGTESTYGMSLSEVTQSKDYSTVPSLDDLRTAGYLEARVRGYRTSSNTAITWSVDYVQITVDYTYTPPQDYQLTAGDAVSSLSESVVGAKLLDRTVAQTLGTVSESLSRAAAARIRTVGETLGAVTESIVGQVTSGAQNFFATVADIISGGGGNPPSLTHSNSAENTGVQTSLSIPINWTPTAGRILVSFIGTDKTSGAMTQPSGWTMPDSYDSSSVSGAFAWKVSDGTETAAAWSWATAAPNGSSGWVIEIADADTLDRWVSANSGSTAVQSQTTGTTAATTAADELAVAFGTDDTGLNWDTGRSWTNSFTERGYIGSGSGNPGTFWATKSLTATGTVETTVSTTDTGDQMYAAVMTFKSTSGSGPGITESIARAAAAKVRTLPDSITVSEGIVRNALAKVRAAGDTVASLVETVVGQVTSGQQNIQATVGDVITLTEGLARAAGARVRTASESLSLSEAVSQTKLLIRTVADSFPFIWDYFFTAGAYVERTLADTVSLTESVARAAAARVRTAAEALSTLTESVSGIKLMTRTVGDTVGSLTESLTRNAIAFQRAASDTVSSISEAIVAFVQSVGNYVRIAGDTVASLTESIARAAGARVRTAADSTTVTETVSRAFGTARTLADTISSLTETVARASFAKLRSVADSTTVTESVSRRLSALRSAADSVTITEAVSRASQALIRTTSESIDQLLESVVALVQSVGSYSRSVGDSVAGIAESASRSAASKVRTLADSTTLTEAVTRIRGTALALGDSISSLTEGISQRFGAVRSAADSISLTETLGRVVSRFRTASDSITLTETVSRLASKVRSVADDASSLVETVVRAAATRVRAAADSTTLTETVSRLRTVPRTVGDTVGSLAESVSRGASALVRTAADALPSISEVPTLFLYAYEAGRAVVGTLSTSVMTGTVGLGSRIIGRFRSSPTEGRVEHSSTDEGTVVESPDTEGRMQ